VAGAPGKIREHFLFEELCRFLDKIKYKKSESGLSLKA
jgi:hypothetical protein